MWRNWKGKYGLSLREIVQPLWLWYLCIMVLYSTICWTILSVDGVREFSLVLWNFTHCTDTLLKHMPLGHVKSRTCFHGYVSQQVDLWTASLGYLLILVHTKIAHGVHRWHNQDATVFTRWLNPTVQLLCYAYALQLHCSVIHYNTLTLDRHHLTSVSCSTLAPAWIRRSRTLSCPSWLAACSGVDPSCDQDRKTL